MLKILRLALAFASVQAHAPTSARTRDARRPVHLGDVTSDSWVAYFEMSPGRDVAYYSFDAAMAGTDEENKLWLGTYVPACRGACPEDDFTFTVGVWGMPYATSCGDWKDGWGRAGDVINNVSVPSYVTVPMSPFVPQPPPLALRASPASAEPDVFEPYTPTVFRPRGGCVAEFPSRGRYYLAVWSDNQASTPRRVALGVGLAERSVFQPLALILGGFTTISILSWGYWSWVSLFLWPVFVAALVRSVARSVGWTPARPSLQFAVLGQVVWATIGLAVFMWSVQVADQGTDAWLLPLTLRVILPLAIAFTLSRSDRRGVVALCALLALFTGTGLVFGPVSVLCVAITAPRRVSDSEDAAVGP